MCMNILSKALLLFTLLLEIAYVELMVGKKKAWTCVTYIAKSNNRSMEMTNHTSWSRLCTRMENGWWNIKIKDFLHESPSPLFEWLENMAILFLSLIFSCTFVSIFFVVFLWHAIFSLLLTVGHNSLACHLSFLAHCGPCFFGMPSFLSLFFFFIYNPCLSWRIIWRGRSFSWSFILRNGWNGIANFQCRSLACGVYVILIKQVWNVSH